MAKYRVIACDKSPQGNKCHNFPIGSIVEPEGKGLYTNGFFSQCLLPEEIEKVEK